MLKTMFAEYLERVMPKLPTLIEKVNGKRKKPIVYLHKEMLRREYSPDQKWASASVDTSLVAADMVAMDSPLSPKTRPTLTTASGNLPKIGIYRVMKESQINRINLMRSQQRPFVEIAQALSQDPVDCSNSIDERNELNFLQGLSEGVVIVQDADDPSIGLRIDFMYPKENTFGVAVKDEIEYEDIRRPLKKADDDGNAISVIMLSKEAHTRLRNTQWARELVANYRGQTVVDPSNLPVPTASAFNDAFADDNGGVTFRVVDRTVLLEKNGKKVPFKPFNANNLIYLTDDSQVGALVWGTLAEVAEMNNATRETAAIYSVVDQFKLISRYRTTNPYQEHTTAQAMCLPVIENVDQIYMLRLDEAEAVDESAESDDVSDEYITYKGVKYQKSAVIAALNRLGSVTKEGAADSTVIRHINELSDEQETELLALIASATA
ncbi:MAG: major capsid protein [Clostridiales bacterium]|nr:major capsid protein [Clostridiales bacterium]MCM1576977.1 major capsid protein [Bacteroides sp.]